MSSPLDQFFAPVDPLKPIYSNCSFSFLAVRHQGQFAIIQAVVLLNTGVVKQPFRHFESENVRAGHYRLPEDLELEPRTLVERLMSGALVTPQGALVFPQGSSQPSAAPLHPGGLQNQQRVGVLTIAGRKVARFLDQPSIDWELKASPTPYEHLQDLAFDYGLGRLQEDVATVEAIAYPVVMVDGSSKVNGTTALIGIRAAEGLPTDKVSLGYKVLSQGVVLTRSSIRGATLEWVQQDGVQTAEARIDVPDAALVNCIASYDGVAQHFWWILDPAKAQNPRRAAYEAIDSNLDVLREYIAGKGRREQDDFELGVASLLWMLGFSPAHLGSNRRLETADIIVATPRQRLAVVECTTGMLKADKMARLIERTERVRREVPMVVSVLPVIVTSKPRIDVRADLEAADKLGVLVLTQEQLQEAIDVRTLQLPDPDRLYDEAESALQEAKARHEAEPELALEG